MIEDARTDAASEPGDGNDAAAEAFAAAYRHHQDGALDIAANGYRAVLRTNPDHTPALHMFGVLRAQQGRGEEGLSLITRALRAAPGFAEALANRGLVFLDAGRPNEALLDLNAALRIRPDFPDALARRAEALRQLGRTEEAGTCIGYALKLEPDHAGARAVEERLRSGAPGAGSIAEGSLAWTHWRRGSVFFRVGATEEALADFQRAALLDRGMAEARFDSAMALLELGQLEQAWPGYEWRWEATATTPAHKARAAPFWNGDASLAGKRILLVCEQGYGDSLLLFRYVPLVAARGATVLLLVHDPLERLARSVAGVHRLLTVEPERSEYDFVCPLFSLPLVFGTTHATVPGPVPYIGVPDDLVAQWADRLGPRRRPRIGIGWTGNPAFQANHIRSVPLAALLAALPAGLDLVCLHREIDAADRAVLDADGRVIYPGEALGDFADTAALMMNLDLLVTSDTSIANLAGALGRRSWVMLALGCDWRWLRKGRRTPWYPETELLRQTWLNDWEEVLGEVRERLERVAAAG